MSEQSGVLFVPSEDLEQELDNVVLKLKNELKKMNLRIKYLEKTVESKEEENKAIMVENEESLKALWVEKNRNQELLKHKEKEIRILEDKSSSDVNQSKEKSACQKELITRLEEENKRLKTFETQYPKLIQEIESLRQLNAVYSALRDEHAAYKTRLLQVQVEKRDSDSRLNRVKRQNQALRQENSQLTDGRQSSLLRDSKLASTYVTVNNQHIADLSDEKRPTKLAGEFSELYDNEWIDAVEDVYAENEQEKPTIMLKLLKRANELCNKLSSEHMNNIKNGLCSLEMRVNNPCSSADKKTHASSKEGHESNDAGNPHMSSDGNVNTDTVAETNDKDEKANTLEPNKPSANEDQLTQTGSVGNTGQSNQIEDSKLIYKSSNSEKSENGDKVEGIQHEDLPCYTEKVCKVDFDFEQLQSDKKKAVMDLKKSIEDSISEQLQTVFGGLIADEIGIDPVKESTVFYYIQKCVKFCWSTCRHEPPVHISFPDIRHDMPFDSNVYKPYTKSGKQLDFIVWPALYLHKDGPMLCKGVAQGKNK